MNRNALTWTYRIAAGAAIVCAPFGALHAGFAAAGLVLAVVAVLAYAPLHPEQFRKREHYTPPPTFNPASGLPMNGMFDTAGNPYGYGGSKRRLFHDD